MSSALCLQLPHRSRNRAPPACHAARDRRATSRASDYDRRLHSSELLVPPTPTETRETCKAFSALVTFTRSLTVYERDPNDRRYRMTVDLDHDRDTSQLAELQRSCLGQPHLSTPLPVQRSLGFRERYALVFDTTCAFCWALILVFLIH